MIDQTPGLIDYEEAGEGPTVVLVPGSCSTGAAWRPVMAHWQGQFRCVTTSLLGYGGTAERRAADDTDIAHEREILEVGDPPRRRPSASRWSLVRRIDGACSRTTGARSAAEPDNRRSTGHGNPERNRRAAALSTLSGTCPAPIPMPVMRGETDAIARMIDFYGGAGHLRRLAAARSRLRHRNDLCQFAGLEIGLWFSSHVPCHWRP